MRPGRLYLFVLLTFCALLFSGCAILLFAESDYQDIVIEAEDGGEYDFYVDNSIVCRNTNRCIYSHYKKSICQHTFDVKRGDEIYGTLFYGYWEERSVLAKMLVERDDNVCPEGWSGIHVIVEIDPDIDGREDSAAR